MKAYSYIFKVCTLMGILSGMFVLGCGSNKKNKLIGSKNICNGLIREKYLVHSWGALSADVYADFITDSINFRIFVGLQNDDEHFAYECNHDSLVIWKVLERENQRTNKIDNFKILSLS